MPLLYLLFFITKIYVKHSKASGIHKRGVGQTLSQKLIAYDFGRQCNFRKKDRILKIFRMKCGKSVRHLHQKSTTVRSRGKSNSYSV